MTTPLVATTRRAVLWVPDWPVVAASAEAGLQPQRPGSSAAWSRHGGGLGVGKNGRSKKGSAQAPSSARVP